MNSAIERLLTLRVGDVMSRNVVSIAATKNMSDHLAKMLVAMTNWLERKHFRSIEEIKGLLTPRGGAEPSAFERVNYLRALMSLNEADG